MTHAAILHWFEAAHKLDKKPIDKANRDDRMSM